MKVQYIPPPKRIQHLAQIGKLAVIGDPALLDSAQFTVELIADDGKVATFDLEQTKNLREAGAELLSW